MKIQKQHKYDVLTPQECLSLGIGEEVKCATCGKLILFGISMSRHTYKFKQFSCQIEDEKKDPPDKRRKWNKT